MTAAVSPSRSRASQETLRVLLLASDAYHGFGGIAQYTRDVVDALLGRELGAEVLCLPRNRPAADAPVPVGLTEDSTATRRAGYALRAMRRAVTWRPDVIVCGHLTLLPVAAAAGRATSAPVLALAYGIDAWTPPRRASWAIGAADHVLAISRTTRDRLMQWSHLPPGRVSLLPNAAPRELASSEVTASDLRRRYRLGDARVLLTLARLDARERYKGHDRVLAVLSDVRRSLGDVRYLIAGDGTDRARLEGIVAREGLADYVTFAGRVADAERTAHYQLADAFAMPSTGEGFGYVFLEAMACGTPVLAGRTDGGRDALADGELGVLVDPDDHRQLADGICEVLRRPRGVPAGLERFSFERFRSRLLAVVDSLRARTAAGGASA